MKKKLNLKYILSNHGIHSFYIYYDKNGQRLDEQLFIYSIEELKEYIQKNNIKRKNTNITLAWIHYDGGGFGGSDDIYILNEKEISQIFEINNFII